MKRPRLFLVNRRLLSAYFTKIGAYLVVPGLSLLNKMESRPSPGWYVVYCIEVVVVFVVADDLITYFSARGGYRIASIAVDSMCHALLAGSVWYAVTELTHTDKRADNSSNCNLSIVTQCNNGGLRGRVGDIIRRYWELLLSLICGSAVDVDHFLAAGSLTLSGATSLSTRPFGHCLMVGAVISVAAGMLTNVCASCATSTSVVRARRSTGTGCRIGILVFTAYLVHLLRDSTRRGLWVVSSVAVVHSDALAGQGNRTAWKFTPVSTVPLPLKLVLSIYCILPLVVRCVLTRLQQSRDERLAGSGEVEEYKSEV
jgi:hypothetical protein